MQTYEYAVIWSQTIHFITNFSVPTIKKLIFTKVKQLVVFRKEILLKPLNWHQKFCACLRCMLRFRRTTMVLALFVGRHCLYARCATFFIFVTTQLNINLTSDLS